MSESGRQRWDGSEWVLFFGGLAVFVVVAGFVAGALLQLARG